MASALSAQPNAKPVTGTPPTGPCSIVQVTWPCRPSSIRMRGTSAETPKPSAATSPTASSIAARRAITFSMPNGSASSAPRSTLTSPGQSRIVGRLRRLHLVRVDHHDVDQRAGHVHLAGRQRGRRLAPLDLRDHQAAGVARGERQIERAERRRLVLHRDVAAGIGGGAADDRHVRRERAKVQPLVAIELDHAHEVLARRAVHLAALAARIDEGVEPDLGEDPCPARRPGAQHVEDQAARQIVRLDRVFQDQPPDRRHRQRRRAARIAAGDHALEQARLRQMVDPGNAVHVAGADRMQRGQSARPPLAREALADRAQHPVRRIQAAGRADRHDGAVRDQARGIVRTHCLRQRQTHLPAALCPRHHGTDRTPGRSLPLPGRGAQPHT